MKDQKMKKSSICTIIIALSVAVQFCHGTTQEKCVCVQTETLNVRTCATTSCGIIGQISFNWCMVYLDKTDTFGWHKVRFEGQDGWVSGSHTSSPHVCATKTNGMCAGRLCQSYSPNSARGCDAGGYGCGYYGASRGSRSHAGSDVKCEMHDVVYAPYDGTVIREAKPYTSGKACCNTGFLLQITQFEGDYELKAFYAKLTVASGAEVKRGDPIAIHQGLHCPDCYTTAMTDHVHFQLTRGGDNIDATSYAFCPFREAEVAEEKCEDSQIYTMENFIRLVQKIEKHESDIKDVANLVREQGYGSILFDYLSGYLWGDDDLPDFSTNEVSILKNMIGHSAQSNGLETGVALVADGSTVALGHVITGICAGLKRDVSLSVSKLYVTVWHWDDWDRPLDNLHAATIAGDLGQTTLRFNGNSNLLIGPSGSWNSHTCPVNFTLSNLESEATDAEILGDIDGYIIGTILPSLLKENNDLKLSKVIEDYYGTGLGPNNRMKAEHRIGIFKELMSDFQLEEQTESFTRVYANRYDLPLDRLDNIPRTITSFYNYGIMRDCANVPDMHLIDYFIELISNLEQESNFMIEDMTEHLLHLSKFYQSKYPFEKVLPFWKPDTKRGDSFYWYVASNFFDNPTILESTDNRELGVIEDLEGNALTIGNVILGIYAGIDRNRGDFDTLLGATIAGGMLPYDTARPLPVIGKKGSWDTSCPRKFKAGSTNQPTSAQMIGHIDGFLIGSYIKDYLKQYPNTKLSEVLQAYYRGNGFGQTDVKSSNRMSKAHELLIENDHIDLKVEISLVCTASVDEDPERLKISDCETYSEQAYIQFEKFLNQENDETTVNCQGSKFGDMMKLKPKGASKKTANSDGISKAGVSASQKMVDNDIERINKLKKHFDRAGQETGVHPALIAAIASRESRAGNPALLDKDGFSKDKDNKGYGVMQCDPESKLDCSDVPGPKSYEHIHMMVKNLFIKDIERVKTKHPSWKPEQWLQGAVAAYNFGVDDVQTWENLDKGSTNDDYSSDVIARAQWLVTQHKWTFCNSANVQPSTCGKYGNILKLNPSGASYVTAGKTTLGIKASQKLVEADLVRLNQFKSCFITIAGRTGVPAALLGAIASRESGAGQSLDSAGYNKNGNKHYGVMQCKPKSGLVCDKYKYDSCEHIDMMTNHLINYIKSVKKKMPKWSPEQTIQGAVAATDFGIELVQTWERLDKGSENDDFSNDIIARAQHLMIKHGWPVCDNNQAKANSLPGIGAMIQNYPTYPEHPGITVLEDAKITEMLSGLKTISSSTDAMRLCYMLNKIPGHRLDHSETGSRTGADGSVYYDQARKVKSYLSSRYTQPIMVSSRSDLQGKVGIIYVEDTSTIGGKIGIWNGKGVYGADDITSQGSAFYIWQTGNACKEMAESGDCQFYIECLHTPLKCTDEDYPLAYGYQYCNRFGVHYNEFNDEGKTWVDKVRKCLMKKLRPFVSFPTMNKCAIIKEVAFKSHRSCYVDSGFCGMVSSNLGALWKVFQKSDFIGPDWHLAWEQVISTASSCGVKAGSHVLDAIKDTARDSITWIKDRISKITLFKSIEGDCEQFANNGDCKFYECFEDRFACDTTSSVSVIKQFELPSCLEFNSHYLSFSYAGQSWMTSYQKCIMASLLPLYRSSETTCSEVGLTLAQVRVQCILDANFCSIVNDNQFYIERATELHGYPMIVKHRPYTLPLSGLPARLEKYYYRGVDTLMRDISYAKTTCTNKDNLYELVYSKKLNRQIKKEI